MVWCGIDRVAVLRHAMRLQNLPARACAIVFEQQRIEGFGFDPEVLFLAKLHGLRTAELRCAGRTIPRRRCT